MMGSNSGGGGGGPGGGMGPAMGGPVGGGGDGRHDDEAALTEFLSSLMDYTPTIPDELVEHYLGRSGFHCPDLRLTRLVAVATQKFLSDIASDSLQHCKARVAAPIKDNKSKQPKDRRLVLTMDDLSKALREKSPHECNSQSNHYIHGTWCELETPRVLRRQPFSRNGSFDKGGVDWIEPTCTQWNSELYRDHVNECLVHILAQFDVTVY
ncbi:Transcription initiation factor TFIID subunit 10 [Dichanthelium oligosanthes]|uniref:Transcription initiation factor TFIID subunit 10 n=1 Tax=Dichanthelium oligosanthes TaxID=888268 RepID=A0A1E5VI77_9POAL|nr:Transcription initiation factor TFIID subunit 10 [Dichanthelium oligosanthes]